VRPAEERPEYHYLALTSEEYDVLVIALAKSKTDLNTAPKAMFDELEEWQDWDFLPRADEVQAFIEEREG
jgi:DNA polymerase III sliding clamp (beta) subunit (PCNA family)